jgi:hypothetical protein
MSRDIIQQQSSIECSKDGIVLTFQIPADDDITIEITGSTSGKHRLVHQDTGPEAISQSRSRQDIAAGNDDGILIICYSVRQLNLPSQQISESTCS